MIIQSNYGVSKILTWFKHLLDIKKVLLQFYLIITNNKFCLLGKLLIIKQPKNKLLLLIIIIEGNK